MAVLNEIEIDGISYTLFDINKIYPVGSIYMSMNNTNPSALFGGSWERITDRFLLGAGGSYSAGATGGEKEHTLTVNEMPSHKHTGLDIDNVYYFGWDSGSSPGYNLMKLGQNDKTGNRITTGFVGGSASHNNMPPYIAVYIWKRVS